MATGTQSRRRAATDPTPYAIACTPSRVGTSMVRFDVSRGAEKRQPVSAATPSLLDYLTRTPPRTEIADEHLRALLGYWQGLSRLTRLELLATEERHRCAITAGAGIKE